MQKGSRMQPSYALLSVFHKEGIVEFARFLIQQGWKILSSGGTAKHLMAAGVSVTDVSEVTGFGPVLGHRVVTLAPQIHGGLLASVEQGEELKTLGWPHIGLCCVDLYPLQAEIAREGSTQQSVIEKTDIGGPTMLRSAAKGRRIVIATLEDRKRVMDWMALGCPDEAEFINHLCAKTEGIVAGYALASAQYHSEHKITGIIGTRGSVCKYGENPYQKTAGLYVSDQDPLGLSALKLVEGVAPSYINYTDIDRVLTTMIRIAAGWSHHLGYVPKIAVGVKHGNACGVSAHPTDAQAALRGMVIGDPKALFGGVVMCNFPITLEMSKILREHQISGTKRILDTVVAPSFTSDAIEEMSRKEGKCRMLMNPALECVDHTSLDRTERFRQVRGGFLVQDPNLFILDFKHPELKVYGETSPTPEQAQDLILGWAVGSTSNSNTITLVKDGCVIANAVSQQSRVGAAQLALARAKESGNDVSGAVAYSDSFFPFNDAVEVLLNAGIGLIFASSGSVNDKNVISLCREWGVPLVMMPDTVCRGFFGH